MGNVLSCLRHRDSEFQGRLEVLGLDEKKWTRILRKHSGVDDLLQSTSIAQDGEEFQKLIKSAEDYEIPGLKGMFGVSQNEEHPITEAENELCVRLNELGLDDSRWFKILKTTYSVAHMQSTSHIGLDCLNELNQVCQTRNELERIHDFFCIECEFDSFDSHFVKIENRIKVVTEVVTQIKPFLKGRQTRSNKRMQCAKIQSINEILQLPSTNSIRPNSFLKNVLRDLSNLECCLEVQGPTHKRLPGHLIQTASSGVCLRGIIYKGNGNYSFPADYPVLKVPSKAALNGPNLSETEIVISGDKESVESFIHHTQTYGYVSGSVNLPSRSNCDDVLTLKMKQVPIVSFTFGRNELKLSDSAVNHLKNIGAIEKGDENRVMDCCKEFLNKYGSHVFQGPIHFGGTLWITAKGTTEVDDEDIKSIQLESIAAVENAPLGKFALHCEYNATTFKKINRSKYRRHDSKCVVMRVTTSGGSKTFSYFPTWKLGMSANISSWNVIDRGTAFPVAIWEVLEYSNIENFRTIGDYLFKAWVDMTNVRHTFTNSSELQALIAEVHSYVTSSENFDVIDRQYSILEKLLEIKEKVIKHTRSIKAWSDIFLGSQDFDILTFLKRTVDSKNHYMVLMICKIINDNDILNQPWVSSNKINEYLKYRQLLEKEKVERNSSISEFNDFGFLLEQAILDLEEQHQHQSPSVAAYLTNAVNRLLDVFECKNRNLDAILLLSLTTMLGFDKRTGFLHTKLTLQDVTNLAVTIKNHISTYAELDDTQQKSIFIFCTLLEMILLTKDCYKLKQKVQKLSIYKDLPREIGEQIHGLKNEDIQNWKEIITFLHHTYSFTPKSYKLKDRCFDTIKMLSLEQYFPKKFTRQKALLVPANIILRNSLQNSTNISMYMLQSLIACNYEGRSFEYKQSTTDFCSYTIKLSERLTKIGTSENSVTSQVSPSDVLTALLMCADDFLRQLIIDNLTMCQFSIPLLLPMNVDGSQKCEMLLWATRTIKKRWKTCSGSSCEKLMSMHPIPIVSALRIGRLGISKSNILNAVINDQKHDVFFHYGSNNGTLEKTLSIGLLEMTWYLPAGRNQDKFPDVLTIMNLRGNASHLKDQTAFLREVSFATIAFITSDVFDKQDADLLESLYTQNGHLILVSEDAFGKDIEKLIVSLEQRYSDTCGQSKQVELIYTSKKNKLQVSWEIIRALNDMLSNRFCDVPKRSMKDCSVVAKKIGFYVDEDTHDCLDAKADAEKMLQTLQSYSGDSASVKEKHKMLPLQIITTKIAEKQRQQYQLKEKGNLDTEQYIAKIQLDINSLRNKQKQYLIDCSTLMEIFIGSFSYSPLKRKYFHCWVKILADGYSISQLQPVRDEYNVNWNYLCDLVYENKNKHTPEIKSLRNSLDELQQKLANRSVGLEHFNREIGQMYEMMMDLKLPASTFSYPVEQFPIIAADMLLEGQPLELMDGDASHVPITWIKDVMSCLEKKIGNKRLFVLSVLGIQSTGKSTMLNVMFGLQFAVSAGRCTKGVFSQLVELHSDLQQQTKCDYILVVDTEGLRAPELASIEHTNRDNEIATLVIGLGDATIINIMGENPTDMQDTLQIVVHAFMKMESVKLKPSCLYVHQNVADITASDKITAQRRKMTKMLDDITKIAAKEENRSEKYQVFSDVINFQENKHVVYISSLWEGDPPMAPLNPGYSSCILQVRKNVIDLMQKCDCQTISSFHHKLADLWKAIISENFVYSFKNTLEMQTFNALEKEYVDRSRTMRRHAMILGNEIRIECSRLSPSMLKTDCKKILDKYNTFVDKGMKLFQDSMSSYFESNPRASRWKGRTEIKMDDLHQELKKSLKNEFEATKNKIFGRAKIDSDIKAYEKDIQKKAKELASEFRRCTEKGEEVSEEKIKKVFDKNWEEWVPCLPEQEDTASVISILHKVFLDSFSSQRDQIVNNILRERTYTQNVSKSDIMFNPKPLTDDIRSIGSSLDSCVDTACDYIDSIKTYLENMIKTYKVEGKNFTLEIGRQFVLHASTKLNKVTENGDFRFSNSGLIRCTIYILWSLEDKLRDLQEVYRKETDLKLYMISQKNRLWQMFKDECTDIKLSVSASYAISRELAIAIKESVRQNCITGVIDNVRKSKTFVTKKSYHAQVLIDLADKGEFQGFRSYLTNPFSCMEMLIGKNIRKLCTIETDQGKAVLEEIYFQTVTETFTKARNAIGNTCRFFSSKCSTSRWWSKFLEHIGNQFDVKPEIRFLNNDDIFDVNELNTNLKNELHKLEKEMKKTFSIVYITEIIEPCKQFFKTDLLGCPELCPFCKAPCDLQAGKIYDDHRTECHRPQGVAGYRWTNTRKLCVDVCTSSVMTDHTFRNEDTYGKYHPYKDYQSLNEYYNAWKIKPMAGESQLYWKWFMATYNEKLAKYYDCQPAAIPYGWTKICWETAKEDLINTYNL